MERLKVPYCDTKLGRLSNGPRNATWEVAMAKKKRHSRAEIATKLAEANDLATQGKLQSEIARTLGVSLMTLHRWRKAQPGPQPAREAGQPDRTRGGRDRIAELQLENSRLRRLVTDLLLENIKLEEAAPRQKFSASRDETSIPIDDWVSFPKIPSSLNSHHAAASSPKHHHRKPARWRQHLAPSRNA
jgi:transposase-like protein